MSTQESPESVVVVGAGAASVAVAAGLRRGGYEGAITILGEEPEAPYDRPPLSKQVLAGRWELDRTALLTEQRREEIGVTWRLGERAAALDLERKVITTEEGAELPYGAAVIATGVRPRTLPADGLSNVFTLRTAADAMAIRCVLGPGTRLVIIGAGFLGLEAAATGCALGADVTVVEALERPLADRLSAPVAARLLSLHDEHGARVLTGAGVAAFRGAGPAPGAEDVSPAVEPVRAVELTDGTLLDADIVLVAIGCVPCVAWLEGSGLDLGDGVVCDEYCRAAPGVWAAGDVASWPHPAIGRRIRLEHRMNANEQGRAVAANILGANVPFVPVPFFWTDHHDVKLQLWGHLPENAHVEVADGQLDGDSFVVTFRPAAGEPVVGALGWNAAKQLLAHRTTIEERWPVG